ncbi:thioredoxin domain-containing protein [uncultured Maricaulis sp.]|jgi:thiol-disulfide isomerase/thioredoxin|uniref:thioredoxin domain-containing protein n=1 Tax=uncultured Maricaulis sp. TaxID=174710 RepID=UPI0030D74D7A|tara:strand:+ start:108 stop:542 length:435 start_codon:yes stop_codon:yes gene_type:complete
MRTALIVLALLGAFLAPNFLRGDWAAQAEAVEERPRLVAAMFRSSWCGACRILEPRIDDVRPEYADAAIEFIRFDFTLGQRERVRELAVEADITELYDELVGRTGFLVLMDRETGTVFEIITTNYDRDHIREAFDRWLAITTAT